MADVSEAKTTDVVELGEDEEGHETFNNYTLLRELGRGAFAKVHLCRKKGDDGEGELFAVKVFNKKMLKRKRNFKRVGGRMVVSTALQTVQREVAIMKKMRHPNVVNLYEIIDDETNSQMFMVLEFVENGQVMEWYPKDRVYRTADGGVLSEDRSRRYLRDIVHGLQYVHAHGIVHRDLKPENLLVTGDDVCKIGDFGVAHLFESDDEGKGGVLSSTEGTYHFMPPEAMSGDEYNAYAADVWALGVTLWTFCFGTVPFWAEGVSELLDTIKDAEVEVPDDADADLADLLRGMLNKDTSERLTLEAILEHPWMARGLEEADRRVTHSELVTVTDEEVERAVTVVTDMFFISRLKMKMHRKLGQARKSLLDRAALAAAAAEAEEAEAETAAEGDTAAAEGDDGDE